MITTLPLATSPHRHYVKSPHRTLATTATLKHIAIIVNNHAECAICGELIDEALIDADEFVATTHFIDDPTSPLLEFSDAPMHKECFLAWPLREQFIQTHNDVSKKFMVADEWYWHMNDDGDIVRLSHDGKIVMIDEEAEEQKIEGLLALFEAKRPKRPRK